MAAERSGSPGWVAARVLSPWFAFGVGPVGCLGSASVVCVPLSHCNTGFLFNNRILHFYALLYICERNYKRESVTCYKSRAMDQRSPASVPTHQDGCFFFAAIPDVVHDRIDWGDTDDLIIFYGFGSLLGTGIETGQLDIAQHGHAVRHGKGERKLHHGVSLPPVLVYYLSARPGSPGSVSA